LFQDIETPLRYFKEYEFRFFINPTKPLQVSKQFFGAMNSEGLNTEQQIFITKHLVSWFKSTVFNNEFTLQKVADILQKEIEALKPEKMKNKKPFDWSETQQHLETLPDTKAKIKYLIEQKTRYKQESGYDFERPNFGEKCELEIEKLKALAELESIPEQTKVKPQYKLSNRQGAKTDLIRILNAVYELRMIEKTNGQIPSKEMFMKQAGEFFGTDLSKYDIDLSQALNNTSLEANLKVFEQMKEVTQNSHYIGKKVK
jgi:hypothetical protein